MWANGTSTVALTPASVASGWGFRRELYHLRRLLVWLLPPSLIGGAIGTFLVTMLPPEYFNRLVPWLILTAATLFTLQPLLARRKPAVAGQSHDISDEFTHIRPLAGRDGGAAISHRDLRRLFGAGIGILMLSGSGVMGLSNIHQMNGLKSVLATAINGHRRGDLRRQGKVVWPFALAMMATSIVGGYLAAHYSRQIPGKYVRWFVIVVGVCPGGVFLLEAAGRAVTRSSFGKPPVRRRHLWSRCNFVDSPGRARQTHRRSAFDPFVGAPHEQRVYRKQH